MIMPKTSLVTYVIIPFLSVTSLYAQYTEKKIFEIVYDFNHYYDTSNLNLKFDSKYKLQVGTNFSFFSKKNLNLNGATNLNKANEVNLIQVVGRPSTVVENKIILKERIILKPTEDKIILSNSIGFQDYLVEFIKPIINWELQNEFKSICGYRCQKAVGIFGGRLYFVWFTTDLPFSYGPWKLNGLPGIILEAVDDKNHISFIARDISISEDFEFINTGAYKPVVIKEKDYERLKSRFERDPIGSSQAQLKNGEVIHSIVFIDVDGKSYYGKDAESRIKNNSRYVINNPIELLK